MGVPLEKMGTPIQDPIRLQIPHPKPTQGGGLIGQVMEIDTFGNLSTNIDEAYMQKMGNISVTVGGKRIEGLSKTFGDQPIGSLVALIGTSHDLILAIVNGDAAHSLNISIGDPVEVHPL